MDAASLLFRRDCVQCPETNLSCNCSAGQKCVFTVKTCEKCPEAKCIDQSSGGSMSKKSAGAIAGGVAGGVFGLGILITFIFWWVFRHRRRRHLQALNEVALEFGTPSEYPDEHDGTSHVESEAKAPSITSTYGGVSRRSNVIPIVFPLNPHENLMDNHRESNRTMLQPHEEMPAFEMSKVSLASDGLPQIRDSIRDSEYSMGSEHSGLSNQGLRAYDVAVQGIPNLIDVNKSRKPPQQPNLHRISEGEPLGSSQPPKRATIISSRSGGSKRASSRISKSSFAALPSLPTDSDSNRSTRSEGVHEVGENDTESPFGDNQTPEPAQKRVSQASSEAYSAQLPDEVRLYQGFGYL